MHTIVGASDSVESDSLEQLAILITENDLKIDMWETTIKEKFPQKDIHKHIETMKKTLDTTIIENNDSTKYYFERLDDKKNISVYYKVIIPHNKKHVAELVAEVKGDLWDESTAANYQNELRAINNLYFTENASKFTCLTTKDSGIMKTMDSFNYILEELELKYVSTQSDKLSQKMSKDLVYGYTTRWDEKLVIMDKPMNTQIVLQRTDNGKSKLIIGTPILINEY